LTETAKEVVIRLLPRNTSEIAEGLCLLAENDKTGVFPTPVWASLLSHLGRRVAHQKPAK
jgi:hypothetical protein